MTDQTEKKPRASRRKKVEEQDTTVIELPAAVGDLVQTEAEAGDRVIADENEVLELPVLPLRGTVVFPLTVVPLADSWARRQFVISVRNKGLSLPASLLVEKLRDAAGGGNTHQRAHPSGDR